MVMKFGRKYLLLLYACHLKNKLSVMHCSHSMIALVVDVYQHTFPHTRSYTNMLPFAIDFCN